METLLAMIERKHEGTIYLMTGNVLHSLLHDAIGLYSENMDMHGHEPERSMHLAISEVFEGYHAQITDLDAEVGPRAQCQNCCVVWPESKLREIEDLRERVLPGEPMPSGECPVCRALCQRLEE